MQFDIVPKEKIVVTNGQCLGPGIVALLGSFLDHKPLSTQFPEDCIELRVLVCEEKSLGRLGAPALYVQHFGTLPLDSIKGNLVLPAEDLLKRSTQDDGAVRPRERVLQTIVRCELQELRFDLGNAKKSCSLWFRCMKEHPVSIIPRAGIHDFFVPRG